MPQTYWMVLDQNTSLFLTYYSTVLANCLWGNSIDAIHFSTEAQANTVIESWGEVVGQRFIGKNPKPH